MAPPVTRPAVLALALLLAACGSEPSEPPALGTSVTLIFPNGVEESAIADTASYYGPTPAIWNGTDTTYYFRLAAPVPNTGAGANPHLPALTLGAGLAHQDLAVVPRQRSYVLGQGGTNLEGTGFGVIVGSSTLVADSGTLRFEKVGDGRIRWTVSARMLNQQQQVAYRLRAVVVAARGIGPAIRASRDLAPPERPQRAGSP